MVLDEVKKLLDGCVRSELRDHAFGDMEVTWTKNNMVVGGGYFSGSQASVWIDDEILGHPIFEADDAYDLHGHGILGQINRNDETGPERYVEGQTMPGLTSEG